MITVTLEEAQAHLADLIARLHPGEVVSITKDDRPVATLVGPAPQHTAPRKPGSAIGQFAICSDDDEFLADFREYMP